MCEGCRADPSPKMDRRNFLRLGSAGLAGAVLLGTTGGRVLAQSGSSLEEEFRAAATEYGVPQELLLAMGYTNTFWEMPPPGATDYEPGNMHGRGTYGIMQLYQNPSRDTLGRAAGLTGLSERALKNDRAANVRGGAAVLADMAGASKPDSLNGWQEVVEEYGGIGLYAQEVFQTLKDGASATISTGESLRRAPQDVEIPVVPTSRAATDYRRAEWYGAHGNNYKNANREKSHRIDRLIVHVAEGSVAGTVSWFNNPTSYVSAHYVVGAEGRVIQCVRHEDIAYHAGEYNTHSIGIEHGGDADKRATWNETKMRASAKLAAYCCRRHKIRVDRQHIIEHNRVPGTDHYCPGPYFPYKKYLSMVRRLK